MSDTSNEFTLDDDGGQQNGGTLRQKLEQALALLNAKDKELQEFKSKETERSVKSTWDDLKVPDAIRGFYNGDKTPDAMKQWWEASKGFFNIAATEEQAPAGNEQETPEQREHREAAERYQEATSLGSDALEGGFDAATAKAKQAAKTLKGTDLAAAKQEYYRSIGLAEY